MAYHAAYPFAFKSNEDFRGSDSFMADLTLRMLASLPVCQSFILGTEGQQQKP